MIDLHCHILPGLDDGAKNLEESIAMARTAAQYGVSALVCTPHVHERPENKITKERIEGAVESLGQALKENGIDLELYVGAEYYMNKPFPSILEDNHPLAAINNTRYVLVEFPMLHLPPYLEFSTLQPDLDDPELKKLLPFFHMIVAHPERNAEIDRDPERAGRLKDLGALLQVNMGSLMGQYGRRIRRTAEKLLKGGLVDLVATDAHSSDKMEKIFEGAEKRINRMAGERGYRLLCEHNPLRIVQGEEVESLY